MIRTTNNVHRLPRHPQSKIGYAQPFLSAPINQQFIVYDEKVPVHIFQNINDAIDCLSHVRALKIQSLTRYDDLEIHLISSELHGRCVEHVIFTYDESLQCIVQKRSSYENQDALILGLNRPVPTQHRCFHQNPVLNVHADYREEYHSHQYTPNYDQQPEQRYVQPHDYQYDNHHEEQYDTYRTDPSNHRVPDEAEIENTYQTQRVVNKEINRPTQYHYSHPNKSTLHPPVASLATSLTTSLTANLPTNMTPIEHKNVRPIRVHPPSHQHIQHAEHNQHNMKQNTVEPQVQKKDELEAELVKLTKLLSKVSEQSTTKKVVDDLENIYTDVQEEAELDAEIKSTKTKLDKTCAEKKKRERGVFNDINDINDETVFSDNEEDSEDEESPEKDSNSEASVTSDDQTDDAEDQIKVSDKNPAELNELIKARNVIKTEIDKQEIVVNKANEKLNEDLFLKRCEDQKKRKEEQRNNERLSIFAADKNTYLVMQSKVNRGILKESNVSPFFNHKYHIIKFMENEKLISLKSNSNVKEEAHIFNQLHKVIDGYDYEETSETEEQADPMNEIEEAYLPLCEKFLEIIENSANPIISEKKVHDILNNNPEIKKAIFKETADQTVFEKDTCKEEYKEAEDRAKREKLEDGGQDE